MHCIDSITLLLTRNVIHIGTGPLQSPQSCLAAKAHCTTVGACCTALPKQRSPPTEVGRWHLQVNLVATQLVLDREHPNRMVFEEGQGLDPNIDLKFRGANLRALIQGKASTWQSHLTLTPTGGSGGAKLTPLLPWVSPDSSLTLA